MIWFTSDLHFGDNRLEMFSRDMFFQDLDDFERTIIRTWNLTISKNDIVYIIGDVALNPASCLKIKELSGKKILIRGNYDRDDMTAKYGVTQYLSELFDEIYDEKVIEIYGILLNLNHFPEKCRTDLFNITGHIHGLWRVQRNMINVGIDAWNYQLLNKDKLLFFYNAIKKYYDVNVFAGELNCNKKK